MQAWREADRQQVAPRERYSCRVRKWLLVLLLAAVAAPRSAAAEEDVIAILPLAPTSERVRIYAAPVVSALAKQLRQQRRWTIETLSTTGVVPARVRLVVDVRVLELDEAQVALEARLRDPTRGIDHGTATSDVRALTSIDVATTELAARLVERIELALQEPTPVATAAPVSASLHVPRMVVFTAVGPAQRDEALATQAARQLAARLGLSPVPSAERGLIPPDVVVRELARADAAYGLMVLVQAVELDWHEVLFSARGRARVVLVDRAARAIYDDVVVTDTVVGSRGDGRAALVQFVVEQLLIIARPPMQRALQRIAK